MLYLMSHFLLKVYNWDIPAIVNQSCFYFNVEDVMKEGGGGQKKKWGYSFVEILLLGPSLRFVQFFWLDDLNIYRPTV